MNEEGISKKDIRKTGIRKRRNSEVNRRQRK